VDAVLKAPGYADRAISLDPARDRPLVVELAKEVSAKPIKEKPSKETPSKETASKRHSSHESRSKPPPPAGERPTAKPEQPGYFGVGD
jgi:hypothetical protein